MPRNRLPVLLAWTGETGGESRASSIVGTLGTVPADATFGVPCRQPAGRDYADCRPRYRIRCRFSTRPAGCPTRWTGWSASTGPTATKRRCGGSPTSGMPQLGDSVRCWTRPTARRWTRWPRSAGRKVREAEALLALWRKLGGGPDSVLGVVHELVRRLETLSTARPTTSRA